jgi:hypothetical protein
MHVIMREIYHSKGWLDSSSPIKIVRTDHRASLAYLLLKLATEECKRQAIIASRPVSCHWYDTNDNISAGIYVKAPDYTVVFKALGAPHDL